MSISRELGHDLKNPLTVIEGYVSLLAESDITPEQSNYISKIEEAQEKLLALIDSNTDSEN